MSKITIAHTYAQSPSTVFAALNDFAGIYRFHPLLESSPLVDGTPETGAGSERVCHLHDGNTLHERLTGAELDSWLTVEIVDTSMPMASGGGRYDLAPTRTGGTELTMTMDFTLKMGLLGRVLDTLVVGRKLRANLELVLASLEQHLESGEDVPRAWASSAA
ncbi:MAG: hypothetical protein ACI9K2_004446 [Myxococcota bacterium]|jgi:hypothetical protein